MAIISESKKSPVRGYRSAQTNYAIIYIFLTLIVLLMLNLYCQRTSQRIFYEGKETTMLEKCQLASSEISSLEVINPSAINSIVTQLESIKVARLIITDQACSILYDSDGMPEGNLVLFPEILQAIEGNDVFSWQYDSGTMCSHAATPVFYYGTIVGCVYMTEYDLEQGMLIQALLQTVLQITLILEAVVIIFSIIFSGSFSRRIGKFMNSMRIIQRGDYTHKVDIGGNDELTLLGNEFNDLTDKLQTSEEKRRRFISDASHELKTPLASIKLLTDSILQNEMDTDTMRDFVGDIGNEAERLNRMTEKMLSLTRIDRETEADSELINMAPTVLRVTKMLTPVAEKASVNLELDTGNDSLILVPEDDFYQIVFNLIENGIKYNKPGGKLLISFSREADNAIITFQDTGVGIPEDALGHIFERFYRVDKARSRATGGSGLGLSIVKAIVERNRGEIQVESMVGQGTQFKVSFYAFDMEDDIS